MLHGHKEGERFGHLHLYFIERDGIGSFSCTRTRADGKECKNNIVASISFIERSSITDCGCAFQEKVAINEGIDPQKIRVLEEIQTNERWRSLFKKLENKDAP
jgi:hypothetical protein